MCLPGCAASLFLRGGGAECLNGWGGAAPRSVFSPARSKLHVMTRRSGKISLTLAYALLAAKEEPGGSPGRRASVSLHFVGAVEGSFTTPLQT